MKRPSFQFYPADWRKDAALQSCSLGAQGLWINAMCIAHECEPYGHLVINGRAMTTAQISRLVGLTPKECQSYIDELIHTGVASRSDDGVIYSRRMVKDEQVRNARAAGGHAGAEHGKKGAEHGKKGGRPRKETGDKKPPLLNTEIPPLEEKEHPPKNPPPSSSSSTSVYTHPNGCDGEPSDPGPPAMTTKEEIWHAGKSLLLASGMPDKQCGTYVGKLCKDYGNEVVVEAVRTAVVERPADPASFLKALCQTKAGERAPAQGRRTAASTHDAWDRINQKLRNQQEQDHVIDGDVTVVDDQQSHG